MSKLTPHQVRAMIAQIEATIFRYETETPTNATLRKVSKAHARLDAYRAELAGGRVEFSPLELSR